MREEKDIKTYDEKIFKKMLKEVKEELEIKKQKNKLQQKIKNKKDLE